MTYTSNYANTLYVICFSAPWCGPCKKVKPHLDTLSIELTTNNPVIYYTVDIEEEDNDNIVSSFEIKSLPTIVFIKNGVLVNRITGGNDLNGITNSIIAYSQ